jgi:hypothetical protein
MLSDRRNAKGSDPIMCGIHRIYELDGGLAAIEALVRMVAVTVHCGPDAKFRKPFERTSSLN